MHVGPGGAFGEEAACAASEGGEEVFVEREGGGDQDPRVVAAVAAGERAGEGEAVGAGHADVGEDDLRVVELAVLERFVGAGGASGETEAGRSGDEHLERVEEVDVVIDEQDRDCRAGHGLFAGSGVAGRCPSRRKPPSGVTAAWR